MVDGGRGTNDGFCGGDPLWVADRFDDVDRRWIWEWVETGKQRVKTAVGVAAAIPCGSCGGVGSRGTVWQLSTVVAMVVAAESAPWVLCAQAEG